MDQVGNATSSAHDVWCLETTSQGRAVRAAADEALALLSNGSNKSDVLVVAASRTCALEIVRTAPELSAVVVSYDALTQQILNCGNAARLVGRSSRVLLPYEEKVLLEDMKVSGIKQGRLREMLRFLFKGLSEGSNTNATWLINGEERSLFALLSDHLKEREAIMPCERGGVALDCLDVANVLREFSKDHLIVCGYSSLDVCGQKLMGRLAGKRLVAIGNRYDAGVPYIPFPHPQAIAELAESCSKHVNLDSGATAQPDVVRQRLYDLCVTESPLARDGAGDTWNDADESCDVFVCATPEDEFELVASRVAHDVETGVNPSDILVVAPNPAYVSAVSEKLGSLGIPTHAQLTSPFSKGDPRKTQGAGAAQFITALGLLANPNDVSCWRSWLGFGDWLLRSDAWELLRRIAGEKKVSILGALDLVRESLSPDSPTKLGPGAAAALKFAGPLAQADALISHASQLAGARLVDAVAKHVGWSPAHELDEALATTDGSAAQLWSALRDNLVDPCRVRDATVVSLPDECRGVSARIVYMCGMVDGYTPVYAACDDNETHDHRHRFQRRERERLLTVLGSAGQRVRFTAFAETDAETAARSKLDVGRYFIRKKTRLATAKPSSFLWECMGLTR